MKKKSRIFGSIALAVLMIFMVLLLGCPTVNDSPAIIDQEDEEEEDDSNLNGNNGNNGTTSTTESVPSGALTPTNVTSLVTNINAKTAGGGTHTLTTSAASSTITLAASDDIYIPNTGTLILGDKITLDLSAAGAQSSTGKVDIRGTIQTQSGATLIVGTEDYFNATGKIEFVQGSVAKIKEPNATVTNFLGNNGSGAIYTWATDSSNGKFISGHNSLTLTAGTLVVNNDSSPINGIPHSVIQPGDMATISSGATLRIAKNAEFRLLPAVAPDAAAKIVVGGTIIVEGKLTFDVPFGSGTTANTQVNGGGKIRLLVGSTLTVPEQGTPIEVVGTTDNAVFKLPETGNSIIEIGAGTSEFTFSGSDGVTLNKDYSVYETDTIKVATDGKLTLSKKLTGKATGSDTTATASQIIIIGTVTNGSSESASAFYTSADSDDKIADSTSVPVGTYKWVAEKGWVKQTSA
jgi:hypothetical protein